MCYNQFIKIMTTTEAIQNPFKIGDILHHQYRYQASFPQFYKVVKVSPKSVVVVRLGNRMVANHDGYGQAGLEVPDELSIREKERRCVLKRKSNGEIGALVDSYCGYIAKKWDGKPKEFYGD